MRTSFPTDGFSTSVSPGSNIIIAPSMPTVAYNREDEILDRMTSNLTPREQDALGILLRVMNSSFSHEG
jgi:hypothetical protein